MQFNKATLITGLAIFSLFFGAGNLILPPFLGYNAGDYWYLVLFGFIASAVFIPILGIYAHAKLQGTMLDFGRKVHPTFSLIYCIIVYAISVSIPAPRTASVTYEMAFDPYFEWPSLVFSAVYFTLVMLFALNRSKIITLIGKYLTPIIVMILIAILGVATFAEFTIDAGSKINKPFTDGLIEGYQTFDALAAIVVGAVIIISLKLQGVKDYKHMRNLIAKGGLIAGLGLLLIYGGLIFVGSLYYNETLETRTDLLSYISYDTLGSGGRTLLALLIGLACFTTATGIVTGTADFVKGLFKENHNAYVITVIATSLLGILIGQFDVSFIINIAVPALFLIYPLTITLILLNAAPQKWGSPLVFRISVLTVILFSLPDLLKSLNIELGNTITGILPLGEYTLGWLIPLLLAFIVVNIFEKRSKTTDSI